MDGLQHYNLEINTGLEVMFTWNYDINDWFELSDLKKY